MKRYGCEESKALVASDRPEVLDVRKSSRKVPKVPREPKKNQTEQENIIGRKPNQAKKSKKE